MCWACEEEAMFRRYQLEIAVERGVIPPGFEPADFEAAGLPVPGARAGEDGATANASVGPKNPQNQFACDSPSDGE
jgi:hypothetical protein